MEDKPLYFELSLLSLFR